MHVKKNGTDETGKPKECPQKKKKRQQRLVEEINMIISGLSDETGMVKNMF